MWALSVEVKIFWIVDICFLRFDFETFTTAGPTATDDSNGCPDTFAVTAVSFKSISGIT